MVLLIINPIYPKDTTPRVPPLSNEQQDLPRLEKSFSLQLLATFDAASRPVRNHSSHSLPWTLTQVQEVHMFCHFSFVPCCSKFLLLSYLTFLCFFWCAVSSLLVGYVVVSFPSSKKRCMENLLSDLRCSLRSWRPGPYQFADPRGIVSLNSAFL